MATALDLLMSAKEDVNLLSEESDICTIDAKTRTIFVPSTIVVGGVQSDKNAERIKFSCPKIVGDNLDLSKFSVRINFENVSSVDFNVSIKDQYICDDVAVDGENVTFSWLIGRNAARYMGTVRFIVCAVKTDSDSNISVEWNTAIAEVPVLQGIEIDQPQIGEQEKDIINQLLELTKNTSAEAVQNVNSAKEQAIKDIQSVSQPDTTLTIEGGLAEAKATGEAIGSLKEDLVELKEPTRNLFVRSLGDLNGVFFTDNGDGGIRITGTCTKSGELATEIIPVSGALALSYKCSKTYNTDEIYIRCRNVSNGININGTVRNTSNIFKVNIPESAPITKCGITVISGVSYDDVFYIQLEKGTEKTEFIPNVSCADYNIREEYNKTIKIITDVDGLSKQLSKQLKKEEYKGHESLSEKEIFDMCKFSSLDFERVIDYNETWSGGTVDIIEGKKYFRSTSNGNEAGYYTRQQKSFKQYIHLKVLCDNPKDIEYVKIMLSPVSGSTVNRATFDITDRIKSEENYLILNRCDSDATQYTAWDAIESTDFVVKAKSDKSVNVLFGVISTYNRKALCSITFDDGHITHYINAYPYMEANNIRGEIAMITDNVGVGNHLTQKQLADLIAHGWDIGSHTKNHIHLSEVSEEEQEYQLLKAKEFLIGIHAGKSAGFVTPPYGSQPTDAVLKKVCTVRRYAVDDYNNQPITDSYRLKTFSIKAKGTTVEEVKEWIDYAIQNQLWLVLTFHMIMDSEIDWAWKIQNFKDTIDYLVSNSDVIDTVSITEGLYKQ